MHHRRHIYIRKSKKILNVEIGVTFDCRKNRKRRAEKNSENPEYIIQQIR